MSGDFPVVKLEGTKKSVTVGDKKTPVLIGERINPTNRKKLIEQLKVGNIEVLRGEAKAQVEAGADCLDINVGVPGIDEKATMIAAIKIVQEEVDVPIVIDSSNPDVIEAALKVVQGRPGINSTTGEAKRMDSILPLVKEYDAVIIGLTLNDAGIPTESAKRIEIAKTIVSRANALGIQNDQILIDPLALACGSSQDGAIASLDTIGYIRNEMKINTTIGLSNISFGMPDRSKLNAAFLLLAVGQGLTSFIGNPLDKEIQFAIRSTGVLWGEDNFGMKYVKHCKLNAPQK
ncbi:MAG TPA: pterin-binding protein [Euryarchaeota archaeon]|nr:pterin-binding protein [Euryarchaeota archaeon]